MRLQSSLPTDTLFGRWVTDSGFAIPLVVLGFAALWVFPVFASIVGGDVFSAEDRYGTWSAVLTRSRSRAEIFAGKVVTALAFSAIAVAVLAVSSVAAGALIIGRQPLINLSGVLLPPGQAAVSVVLAWVSVLAPVFGFTALAVLVSIVTRSSVAGVGLPVLAGLTMQLLAFVDSPAIRPLLMTSAFDAWHGFLTEPPTSGPSSTGRRSASCTLSSALRSRITCCCAGTSDDERSPLDPRTQLIAAVRPLPYRLRGKPYHLETYRTCARDDIREPRRAPGSRAWDSGR